MSLPIQVEPPRAVGPTPRRGSEVLILAWEYPGAHSRRGTALARRVGQVARGLAALGWSVTVIHRLQRRDDPAGSMVVQDVGSGTHPVRRRAVAGPSTDSRLPKWLMPLRKGSTLWTAFSFGDRSGRWASKALRSIRVEGIEPPDIAIAFFTPRGPLAVASALHRQIGIPWIADFQDPWWEGTSKPLRAVVARWMRKTLRSAAMVVQVSPEWAMEDAAVLKRDVTVVRHAVPRADHIVRAGRPTRDDGAFRILYVGSLKEDEGDLGPFMDALALVRQEEAGKRAIELYIAGGRESWSLFAYAATARGMPDAVRWLGWLDEEALREAMQSADCLLLIPMFPKHRQGVPSKLFEYLAYDSPVLIAGRDSGGMKSLLEEWAHPPVVADTVQKIALAMRRARDGDLSGLLQHGTCGNPPVTEGTLASWYSEHMHRVLREMPAS
jgi:hypothetical protein